MKISERVSEIRKHSRSARFDVICYVQCMVMIIMGYLSRSRYINRMITNVLTMQYTMNDTLDGATSAVQLDDPCDAPLCDALMVDELIMIIIMVNKVMSISNDAATIMIANHIDISVNG